MFTMEEIFVRTRVNRTELSVWIERAWVRPVRDGRGWRFSNSDLARVEMLCDLKHDLGLDSDAFDVVLPLLDQVYDLRRTIRALTEAIGELPEESRRLVMDRLSRE
jgi:chaperone modulatory protein CbpM